MKVVEVVVTEMPGAATAAAEWVVSAEKGLEEIEGVHRVEAEVAGEGGCGGSSATAAASAEAALSHSVIHATFFFITKDKLIFIQLQR